MSSRTRILLAATAIVASSVALRAEAQPATPPATPPAGNLDLTMVLLPENAKAPEDVTRHIELPPRPTTPPSHDQPTPEQRPDGVGAGQDTAAEARDRGRDFGHDVADQARENRENAGRGQKPDKPETPTPPIEPPGKPTTPGQP